MSVCCKAVKVSACASGKGRQLSVCCMVAQRRQVGRLHQGQRRTTVRLNAWRASVTFGTQYLVMCCCCVATTPRCAGAFPGAVFSISLETFSGRVARRESGGGLLGASRCFCNPATVHCGQRVACALYRARMPGVWTKFTVYVAITSGREVHTQTHCACRKRRCQAL